MKSLLQWSIIISLIIFSSQNNVIFAQSDSSVQKELIVSDTSQTKIENTINYQAMRAKYPGGDEAFAAFLIKHFKYPKRCRKKGINGYVILRFIVNTDGTVSQITARKETTACPEFTAEAIRVVQLSTWIPASVNGQMIKSYFELPIEFELE
jgi:protein TonB